MKGQAFFIRSKVQDKWNLTDTGIANNIHVITFTWVYPEKVRMFLFSIVVLFGFSGNAKALIFSSELLITHCKNMATGILIFKWYNDFTMISKRF